MPSSGKKQDRRGRSCVGIARRKVIELATVARKQTGQRQWNVEKVPRQGDSKGKNNKNEFKWQMLQVWQGWSHVEGLQVQRNECIRSWRRVGRDGMHRNGKHRFECIGDRSSASCQKKDYRNRTGIDSRAAETACPEECCGRLPDAPHAKQVTKSYRLASGKLLPDLGARKVQVKLKDGSLRYVNLRVADTYRALMAVSEMNDMGHDVFFLRSDRNIKAYVDHRGQGHETGTLERVNGVFELPVEPLYHTARVRRRTALQVRILHFLL